VSDALDLGRLAGAFGPDFTWGAATAAHQVEGAVDVGGRTPSTWDVFAAQPGRTENGDTGEVACDHYHRYLEDVGLLRGLGVDAYRFSLSWSRVQPDPTGAVNPDGLDFYDRLVDALLTAGIEPSATLFHWDTPQWLEDLGGWERRDVAERFADYASVVAGRLGDRVTRWMTVNEPVVVTLFGHGTGVHAPGKALGFDALPVAYHLLLAHGRAVQALRAAGAGPVGIVNNHVPVWRLDDSEETEQAATFFDELYNRLFADPVLLGRWPWEGMEAGFDGYRDDDLAVISTPLDFYGVNYYNPQLVGPPGVDGQSASSGAASDGLPLPPDLPFSLHDVEGRERTDFGWPVVPEGLTELLVGLRERYGDALPPLLVTENGASYGDAPDGDGRVRDDRRTRYLLDHVRALLDARTAGVDVQGYFHWSLLDNFEWAAGYSQRFGLVHVDYETLVRTPKDSFDAYRDLIAAQRVADG
jgi:beta-glucosidase